MPEESFGPGRFLRCLMCQKWVQDFPYLFQYYLHRAPWWRWVGDILLEWSWLGWDTFLQSDPRPCTVLQSECRQGRRV